MYDYSNMLNVTANMDRSFQQPGQRPGVGSAPMNVMPSNAAHQPGMNLQGMLSFLGSAFNGQPQGLLPTSSNTNYGALPSGGIGDSLYQLGQIFRSSRQTPRPVPQPQASPPWATESGFGAVDPRRGSGGPR
jgi:hypothetical protein